MSRYVTFLLLLFAAPVSALAQNGSCKFLCKPVFLIEPTVTFEKDATVFETVFALDLSTPIPRVGVTLEAITKPFSEDNDVELESELNLYWLESEQTQGWVSSHIDFIDKFSPAKRTTDTRAYTHKLNLELDTAVAVFNRLPAGRWLRDVEIEGSLDYVATGLPAGTPRWSFSAVFVIPFVKGVKTASTFGLGKVVARKTVTTEYAGPGRRTNAAAGLCCCHPSLRDMAIVGVR